MIIQLLLRLGAFYCVQVCYCPYLQIHFGQPPYNMRSTLYPLGPYHIASLDACSVDCVSALSNSPFLTRVYCMCMDGISLS